MHRIRISTWVLAAIFVAALALYILFKPSPPPATGSAQHPGQHARSTTPVPGMPPGVLPSSSPHPSASG